MPRIVRSSSVVLALLALVVAAPAHAQRPGEAPRTVYGPQGRILSPRDTVEMELPGRRRVWIDYGRPSMRGRRIMGGLVPYGRVWRTGANAATTLVTDVDLRIGDADVPRGTYTLYTIPEPGGWTLIVNRQTGQWGTQYQAARDLVRIPLHVAPLREPVEQFTIVLERGHGAATDTLAFEWETTRAWVPFRPASPHPRPGR